MVFEIVIIKKEIIKDTYKNTYILWLICKFCNAMREGWVKPIYVLQKYIIFEFFTFDYVKKRLAHTFCSKSVAKAMNQGNNLG